MLQDKAMLMRYQEKSYNPYKRDREMSATTAAAYNADADYISVTKRLVPKSDYAAIQSQMSKMRKMRDFYTRPWDTGIRVMPTANFFDFSDEFSKANSELESLVAEFDQKWPVIRANVISALGDSYREGDIPESVVGRIGINVTYSPIPRAGDFRAPENLDPEDVAKIEAQMLADFQERFKSTDLWQRVHSAVEHISERLHSYETDPITGKANTRLYESVIGNLRDLVSVLPKLNISGDADLDNMHKRLEQELCYYDISVLKDNDIIRQDVASKADQILAEVSAFMA